MLKLDDARRFDQRAFVLDRFLPRLTVRPPVVPAQLQNEAGIVGAAMMATGWTGQPAQASDEEPLPQA